MGATETAPPTPVEAAEAAAGRALAAAIAALLWARYPEDHEAAPDSEEEAA